MHRHQLPKPIMGVMPEISTGRHHTKAQTMQTLELQCNMTPQEIAEFHEATKQWCIEEIKKYEGDPRKEQILEILTSRGQERKIYGDCP